MSKYTFHYKWTLKEKKYSIPAEQYHQIVCVYVFVHLFHHKPVNMESKRSSMGTNRVKAKCKLYHVLLMIYSN